MKALKAISTSALVTALIVALAGCGANQSASEPSTSDGLVTVKMVQEWPTGDAQWIPWVVAKEKGYYKAAGINLDIQVPPNTSATMQYLGTGRSDIAFAGSIDVVSAVAEDAPVISIAKYGSMNNAGIIALKGKPTNPKELKGKTIGTYGDAWSKAQLEIMLKNVGLTIDDVHLVTATDDDVPLLMQKKVDAITGTQMAEGSELKSLGVTNYEMSYGKDFGVPNAPVLNLAANKTWLEKNKTLAKAFIKATVKGINYARSHKTEAVSIFLKAYPKAETEQFATQQWEDTSALFGAENVTVKSSDLAQKKSVWKSLVSAAAKYKIVDQTQQASTYFTNELTEE
ncbi:MAG: ABC transporter substrate-binding protein [Bifidobacterium aquikefiri]|uniref:FMN-dependent alpha-hydroxy acid dehydrogenase n=2 Tax=Bifidobacterium aquikefiri TaxID=1653207 RepID=A0A261G646_9BIFI|nr:ABC transporter substrate-binding protein [Bifidobacterium aquikefiri]OZG66898.1 FMN-dependent alpha-hydroxy acid dehydrogenase [Bifidobacterium aquikefiri]